METRFIGIKTAQAREDFEVWERFLCDKEFSRFIEIGTYKWGMSLFFFLWCKTKKASFHTYDIKFFPATRVVRELGITKCFRMRDVFNKADQEEIGTLIKTKGITIVFCDGGNKPRELSTFSEYLKLGDYIAVHDWGSEVSETDIPRKLKLVDFGGSTRIYEYA